MSDSIEQVEALHDLLAMAKHGHVSSKEARALIAYVVGGYTQKEIAEAMGVSPIAALQTVAKAMGKMCRASNDRPIARRVDSYSRKALRRGDHGYTERQKEIVREIVDAARARAAECERADALARGHERRVQIARLLRAEGIDFSQWRMSV